MMTNRPETQKQLHSALTASGRGSTEQKPPFDWDSLTGTKANRQQIKPMAHQTPGHHLPAPSQAGPFSHANMDTSAREALGHQEP